MSKSFFNSIEAYEAAKDFSRTTGRTHTVVTVMNKMFRTYEVRPVPTLEETKRRLYGPKPKK